MAAANPRNSGQEDGFTLALMAVLLVVAAMAAATIFQKNKRDEFWNPKVDTQANMERIVQALVAYQRQYKNLPCPASRIVAVTSSAHGVANCGLTGTAMTTTGGVSIGAVPYKTLKLSVDISGDAWGNKYTYAVTRALTSAGGNFMTGNGTITVRGPATSTIITSEAGFVLVSHGQDARGAYRNTGTNQVVACSGSGFDLENCDNDTTFFTGTLNRTAGSSYYDDHLLWRPVDYTAQSMQ